MNPTNSFNGSDLVHHFLENSAARRPDKVALIHENVRATYVEINARSNRLAHFLMDRGLKKGNRAVLIFEYSLEYVVAYYGILKMGGVVGSVTYAGDLAPFRPLLALGMLTHVGKGTVFGNGWYTMTNDK